MWKKLTFDSLGGIYFTEVDSTFQESSRPNITALLLGQRVEEIEMKKVEIKTTNLDLSFWVPKWFRYRFF